jgi:hypothetical protein
MGDGGKNSLKEIQRLKARQCSGLWRHAEGMPGYEPDSHHGRGKRPQAGIKTIAKAERETPL